MRFFRHNNDYITLPDQEALFSLPFVLFGYIEKRSLTAFGWRWRKRAVVLNPSGHLIIYKYFLEGIGAGKPFLGRIIHLDAARYINARMERDICYIKIHDHARKRTELRIKGTKARLWAAKVFIHSTAVEGQYPLKVLDSKISASNICNAAVAVQESHWEEFPKDAVPSVSSEDVQGIRISEMLAVRDVDSESDSVGNVSFQNNNMIFGKNMDRKSKTFKLLGRSKSAPEFTASTRFSTAKEASRSVSLNQLDAVLLSRQNRFRRHFQSLIESRFYESSTDCSLNYSVTSIRKLRTQAGKLRMSQVYVPLNTPLIKNEVPLQQQITQRSGPSSPLSTDINYKLWEAVELGDKSETDIVCRF
uniref:PH-15 domain-containing protein n=1 Tax=Setaria digitata TaxID=48799 RepID=A0A915Q1M7_9BILA